MAAVATGTGRGAAKAAVARLRSAGPAGLRRCWTPTPTPCAAPRPRARGRRRDREDWPRVSAAIDAVAAQKDAYASGLYWYTDLEAAKKAAPRVG